MKEKVVLDPAKPFKVVEIPTPYGALSGLSHPVRFIGQFATLEDAQEAAWHEDVDEPAPDKHEFRTFHIIEFRGWVDNAGRQIPYKVHK